MSTGVERESISRKRSSTRVRRLVASQPELIWAGKQPVSDLGLVGPADELAARGRAAELAAVAAGNVVISGDNTAVLRSIIHTPGSERFYVGKVKIAYLDPPYNTGADFSTYRDSDTMVNWLHGLRELLVHVRALLATDGSVWLHLDDSQQHRGRMLLDEVFGPDSFVSTIVWQKRTSRDSRKAFSPAHDYIHIYAPLGARAWKSVRNGLPNEGGFSNPDHDPRGPWRSVPMTAQAGHATSAQFYTVVAPSGERHEPPPGRCWTYSEARLRELLSEGRVYWPRNGAGRPRLKRYESEVSDLSPSTLWTSDFAGDTGQAKREILRQFPGQAVFDTPKPELLMTRIIDIATNPGDLVLDPYLGSGTTAVVAARSGRRFLGIEQSGQVLDEIALPRIRAERRTDVARLSLT